MDAVLTSIPINSLVIIPDNDRLQYINTVFTLPKKIQDILFSLDTGSAVRGIARSYDIPDELQPSIAFAILEIATGKKTFAQLPSIFSAELGLAPVQAQKMASEIEKDIFGPVKGEFPTSPAGFEGRRDEFLSGKNTSALRLAPLAPTSAKAMAGRQNKPSNLLDLKEITAAKRQEQLGGRPRTPLISNRTPLRPPGFEGQGRGTTLPKKPPVTPIDFSKY
ncbi:MAG: hypothetical protein AAB649_05555 [Patescibacteria group bacterium]